MIILLFVSLFYIIVINPYLFLNSKFLHGYNMVEPIISVTPKSVPPKIGPAGLILAEKSAKTGPPGPLLLPKLVRPD